MPITVKHAPSAAAIGETAYTIGRGVKRRWAAEMGQKQQALDIRGMSVALQAKARAAELEQRKEEFDVRTEQDAAARALTERRWNEEPARQLQKGLQQQEMLRKNVAWEYDESQKREMAKITTGVAWLRAQVASGKWTPEQAEQAEQKLWQKYYSIIPLPVYDDKAKPQEMYNSRIVTDPITGARSMMDGKGNFTDVPGGISFTEYSRLYADIYKQMTTKDIREEPVYPKSEDVLKEVQAAISRFSQIQGLAAKAGEEQARQPQPEPGQIAVEQEREAAGQEQQVKMQAAVEALPTLFGTLIKGQPKIGRIKKGKPSRDDVYGEDAYDKMLIEAVERGKQDGISPDVIKAELDKWWDAQHDKERGQMFQKFENRMSFKGAAKDSKPAERKVAPEVEMPLDKFAAERVKEFKSGKIVWTAIRKRFGQETANELKYIVDSGNEQAIANALRRLGII